MLGWAVVFLIIALVAAVFGFGGIAAASAGIGETSVLYIPCAVHNFFDFRVAGETDPVSCHGA